MPRNSSVSEQKSTQVVKKEVLAAAKEAAKDYVDEMKENYM